VDSFEDNPNIKVKEILNQNQVKQLIGFKLEVNFPTMKDGFCFIDTKGIEESSKIEEIEEYIKDGKCDAIIFSGLSRFPEEGLIYYII
jgi:hypothetical protein